MTENKQVVDKPDVPVRFGMFELDPGTGELTSRGRRVPLPEQPRLLLELLLDSPGRLVTLEQIRERLWPPGTHVDFGTAIHGAVNKLRRALGDNRSSPRFVANVPRRGYCFIAPVERIGRAGLPLVGLFPLRAESEVLDSRLASGLADELTTRISRAVSGLVGMVASSAMAVHGAGRDPAEAAAALGLAFAIDATLTAELDGLRLHVELLRCHDRTVAWSSDFRSDGDRLASLGATVAHNVGAALRVELGASDSDHPGADGPAPGVVPESIYAAYLEGRFLAVRRTPAALAQAVDVLTGVVRADPELAVARAALAEAWILRVELGDELPEHGYAHALAEAERALEIDPELAAPHTVIGHVRHRLDWDWGAAARRYRAALRKDPSSVLAHQWYAEHLSQRGRHAQALEQIAQARRLDPVSLPVRAVEVWLRYHAGDLDAAWEACRALLRLAPDFPLARCCAARILLARGKVGEALEQAKSGIASAPGAPYMLTALAVVATRAGAAEVARSARDDLRDAAAPAYLRAKVALALGEPEEALDLLERGLVRRSGWMTDIAVDPELAELRGHPRFERLRELLSLPASRSGSGSETQ